MELPLLVAFLVLVAMNGGDGAAFGSQRTEISKNGQIETPDGTTIQEKTTVDSDCKRENNTAVFPDNTKSTIINDYNAGLGLIWFSTDSRICFVRDIPPAELAGAKGCRDGSFLSNSSQAQRVEEFYKVDRNMSLEELSKSRELKALCASKDILKVKKTDAPSGQDETRQSFGGLDEPQRRQKRSYSSICVSYPCIYDCYRVTQWKCTAICQYVTSVYCYRRCYAVLYYC